MSATDPPDGAGSEPGPRRAGRTALRVAAAALGVAVVAFGVVDAYGSAQSGSGPRDRLHITVPAAPGGGWDSVGREIQAVADSRDLVNTTEVLNIPGAGGTIGLSRVANQNGRGDVLMMTGTVMMGTIAATDPPNDLQDVTPVARLANDYGVVVVPADSPIRNLDDLFEAWRDDPGAVAVGGGSVGGTDHLLAGMLMEAGGAKPADLNYIAYAGGGEAVAGMLNGSLAVGVSGYDEFAAQIESGELRALGLSAGDPVEDIDIPTFREQGVDVELANWRGVVAPPGLSEEQRNELEELLKQVHDSQQWQDTLDKQEWEDTFLTGNEFERFVADETDRINEISKELGLA